MFYLADLVGYVQVCTEIQKSTQSSNTFFDVHLQVAQEQKTVFRVMVKAHEFSKHQLFLDAKVAQKPIIVKNLQVSSTGTLFFKYSSAILDAPPHDVDFKFSPPTKEVTKIDSLLTSLTSGIFTVSGMIKWSGPRTTTEKNGAVVRNALLCDSTGTLELPVWQDHIKELDENKFYTITDTKLRYYYGKCLSTTKTTQIMTAESQDLSRGTITKDTTQWLCCPSIMNVAINAYPVCNNEDCSKKITLNTAGSRVIHCQSCNRAMLLKQCYYEMNINFHLEKDDTIYKVTAFPKIISAFLSEDIYSYTQDTDTLIEKMLLIKNVDFQLSPNQRRVTNMRQHPEEEVTDEQLLTAIAKNSNQEQSQQSQQRQRNKQSAPKQKETNTINKKRTEH